MNIHSKKIWNSFSHKYFKCIIINNKINLVLIWYNHYFFPFISTKFPNYCPLGIWICCYVRRYLIFWIVFDLHTSFSSSTFIYHFYSKHICYERNRTKEKGEITKVHQLLIGSFFLISSRPFYHFKNAMFSFYH